MTLCGAFGRAGETPVPFSHPRHAPLKLKCVSCHEKAESGERAGFPTAGRCLTCHAGPRPDVEPIRKLAALAADAKSFGGNPVYRVPDFVFFSHARHKEAAIGCAVCHGPVNEKDARQVFYPTTMKGCVDCHQSRGAAVSCTICHELNQ